MPESITLMTMFLQALKRVPVQSIFDRDPYESRRSALKGERLLWLLVAFQLIKSRFIELCIDNRYSDCIISRVNQRHRCKTIASAESLRVCSQIQQVNIFSYTYRIFLQSSISKSSQNRLFWESKSASKSVSSFTAKSTAQGLPFLVITTDPVSYNSVTT